VYCSKCGSTIAETVTFCPVCGQAQGAGIPLPTPPMLQPAGPAYVTPDWQPAPVVAYAGFWLRFVASLLDGLIIGLPTVIFGLIILLTTGASTFLKNFIGQSGNSDPDSAIVFTFVATISTILVLLFVGSWLYFALFESSSWQATPGKRVLNLVVTDFFGNRISFGRATGRFFAKEFLSGRLTVYVGYILAGVTERKQALHDMIASTLVLRR
jgi:uncharacterized RDD family membrane protein YckC